MSNHLETVFSSIHFLFFYFYSYFYFFFGEIQLQNIYELHHIDTIKYIPSVASHSNKFIR